MVMLNPKSTAAEKTEEEQHNYGFILVKFTSPLGVNHELNMWGVVPLQMIAIGEMLSALGKSKLLEEANRQSIQVPTPIIRGSDAKGR